MSIREDFFNKKKDAALWDVAVSIKRGNPLPLDSNSVFESTQSLIDYINGPLSYPGQIVSVVEEDKTSLFYLDQNKNHQPIGLPLIITDDKTIENKDGVLQLLGSSTAEKGSVPTIGDNGIIIWEKLNNVSSNDTSYVFEPIAKDDEVLGFSIQTLFNGEPKDDIPLKQIIFDTYTKKEIDAKLSQYKVTNIVSGHDALTVEPGEDGKVVIGFASEIILDGGEVN